MKKKIIIFSSILVFALGCLMSNSFNISTPVLANNTQQATVTYINANPLDVVKSPDKYLNKNIRVTATFDKFTNLGLDYKPAMRSSQTYISFLILRDDVGENTIPLSEMKFFMTRKMAEKFIELETGDKIQIEGKVFSKALSDSWVDVSRIVVLKKKNPKKV